MTILLCVGFFCANAQRVQTAIRIATGEYSDYTQKWTYTDFRDCSIEFIIQSNGIIVKDAARSTYRVVRTNKYEDFVLLDAIDEKGRQCKVKFQFNKSTQSMNITVFYGNYCIIYDMLND